MTMTIQESNNRIRDHFENGREKQAAAAVDAYTKRKMREKGFFRKILTMQQLQDSDLDVSLTHPLPVKIVEMEPDSPMAVSMSFNATPDSYTIRNQKYQIGFNRLATQRATCDIAELRTTRQDIRRIVSDNSLKDLLRKEDGNFIECINRFMVGPDQVVPASGEIQWEVIRDGITRDSLQDAFKILPRTPSSLEAAHCLVNNLTIREIMKWGRDEMGGNTSEDIIRKGWSFEEFNNANWIITIKRDLVPSDSIYFFAEEDFLGKSFCLDDVTMYVKKEAYFLEYWHYEMIGSGIGNTNAVARADFNPAA